MAMNGSPENYEETLQSMKDRMGSMGGGAKTTASAGTGISGFASKLKDPRILLVAVPVIVGALLIYFRPGIVKETPLTPDQQTDKLSKGKLVGWTIGITFVLAVAYYIYSVKQKENREV